jgi:hypothetical protein
MRIFGAQNASEGAIFSLDCIFDYWNEFPSDEFKLFDISISISRKNYPKMTPINNHLE